MIAPEGKIILIPLILMVLVCTGVQTYYPINGLKWFNIFLSILTLFCLYFFRDPLRIPPEGNDVISPADGKVVQIIPVNDPEIGEATQISIFLSIWNVHRQRVPYSGKVLSKQVNQGSFLAAFNHKASTDNAQTNVLIETENGNLYKVKQITGWIARRIINYLLPEKMVEKGQQLGFICFGSRVDLIVPGNFEIDVNLGDMVRGNQTVIGRFK